MNGEKDEFYKAPCYYTMLHFSKVFVPGTRIIRSSIPNKVLLGQRPNGDLVGVVQNLTPFESEYTFTKVTFYSYSRVRMSRILKSILIGSDI